MSIFFIKFFSGTQVGAILELEQNKPYIVGNSYDYDIYIVDENNQEQTAYFTFVINTEDQIIFTNNNAPLVKNSCALISATEINNTPIFFKLNDLKIGIGTQDHLELWPEINLSEISELEHNNEDNLLQNNQKIPQLDQYNDLPTLNSHTPNIKPKLLSSVFFIQFIKKIISSMKYFCLRYPLYMAILIFLLMGFLSCFIIATKYKSVSQNNTIHLDTEENNQYIQTLRKTFMQISPQYPLLNLNKDSSGKYNLLGLVAHNDDILFLKNYFKNYNDTLIYQITTIPNAIKSINSILTDNNNGKLIANFDNNTKKIKISGIINDTSILDDLQLKINNKIPGLGDLDLTQIYDIQQINNDLTTLIGNNKDLITINNTLLINYSIQLNGFLEQDRLTELNKQIEDFKDRYQIIKITSNIRDIYSSLPFHIYSVFNGTPSFIILNTGKKLFVGGEIDGYRLSSIDETKIIFTGKYTITIPLDQLNNNLVNNQESQTKLKVINNSHNSNGRNQVLNEEADNLQNALNNELVQLDELNKYKIKFTDDKTISEFINKQIDNLQQDIEFKKHELDTYQM